MAIVRSQPLKICCRSGRKSDLYDTDEVVNSPEVIAIARVKIQPVGVGRRRNEQVSKTPSGFASFTDDGGNDEPVAPHGCSVERNRSQRGLDFLESQLPSRRFTGIDRQVRAGGKFSGGDSRDRYLIGQGSDDLLIMPIDDDRRVEQPGDHSD